MNKGDLAVEHGEVEEAMEQYSAAEKMFPNNAEMKFWHAVTLSNIGKLDEALPLFRQVFQQNKDCKELVRRLRPVGLLKGSDKEMNRILELN